MLFATTHTPESPATTVSNPVPTSGFSGFRTGTACRCIFEPIRALFASSCSKKGINDAATDTTCCGATSIKSILSDDIRLDSPLNLTGIRSSINLFDLSRAAFAWAITCSASSIAER